MRRMILAVVLAAGCGGGDDAAARCEPIARAACEFFEKCATLEGTIEECVEENVEQCGEGAESSSEEQIAECVDAWDTAATDCSQPPLC